MMRDVFLFLFFVVDAMFVKYLLEKA